MVLAIIFSLFLGLLGLSYGWAVSGRAVVILFLFYSFLWALASLFLMWRATVVTLQRPWLRRSVRWMGLGAYAVLYCLAYNVVALWVAYPVQRQAHRRRRTLTVWRFFAWSRQPVATFLGRHFFFYFYLRLFLQYCGRYSLLVLFTLVGLVRSKVRRLFFRYFWWAVVLARLVWVLCQTVCAFFWTLMGGVAGTVFYRKWVEGVFFRVRGMNWFFTESFSARFYPRFAVLYRYLRQSWAIPPRARLSRPFRVFSEFLWVLGLHLLGGVLLLYRRLPFWWYYSLLKFFSLCFQRVVPREGLIVFIYRFLRFNVALLRHFFLSASLQPLEIYSNYFCQTLYRLFILSYTLLLSVLTLVLATLRPLWKGITHTLVVVLLVMCFIFFTPQIIFVLNLWGTGWGLTALFHSVNGVLSDFLFLPLRPQHFWLGTQIVEHLQALWSPFLTLPTPPSERFYDVQEQWEFLFFRLKHAFIPFIYYINYGSTWFFALLYVMWKTHYVVLYSFWSAWLHFPVLWFMMENLWTWLESFTLIGQSALGGVLSLILSSSCAFSYGYWWQSHSATPLNFSELVAVLRLGLEYSQNWCFEVVFSQLAAEWSRLWTAEWPALSYFFLPQNAHWLGVTSKILEQKATHRGWMTMQDFYDPIVFDTYGFISRESEVIGQLRQWTPIPGIDRFTFHKSTPQLDELKLEIMLHTMDVRFRGNALFSLGVLEDNSYITADVLLPRWNEFPYFHDYLNDLSGVRRRRRRKVHLIKTIFSTSSLLSYSFMLLVVLAMFLFVYQWFTGFRRIVNLDSVTLYNEEAFWLYHQFDDKAQRLWFEAAIFFFDSSEELFRFQKLLNYYVDLGGTARSFWDFSAQVRRGLFSSSGPVWWVRSLHAVEPWSSLRRKMFLSLSEYFLQQLRAPYHKFYHQAHRYLLVNKWWPTLRVEMALPWKKVKLLYQLSFDKVTCLEWWKTTAATSFTRNHFFVGRSSSTDWLREPYGRMTPFYFYLWVVPLYYKTFNLTFYNEVRLEAMAPDYSWNFSLAQLWSIFIRNSFPDVAMAHDGVTPRGFSEDERFLLTLEQDLLVEDTNFLSYYYHDTMMIHSADFVQWSLFFVDRRTADMTAIGGSRQETVDENEEEEEEELPLIVNYIYWVDWIYYDIEQWDQGGADYLDQALQSWFQTSVYGVMHGGDWVKTMLDEEDFEEHVSVYLLSGVIDRPAKAEIEHIEHFHWQEAYFTYETQCGQQWQAWLHWMDRSFFAYRLPWWFYHKDKVVLDVFPQMTPLGLQYFNQEDESDLFPFFFFWVLVFGLFLWHQYWWLAHTIAVPFFKSFYLFFFILFFVQFQWFDYIPFDFGWANPVVFDLIFYDRERAGDLTFFIWSENYSYFSHYLLDALKSQAWRSDRWAVGYLVKYLAHVGLTLRTSLAGWFCLEKAIFLFIGIVFLFCTKREKLVLEHVFFFNSLYITQFWRWCQVKIAAYGSTGKA